MKHCNSEFEIFDSIVNGDLRPYLQQYSSENYLKKLNKQGSVEISISPGEMNEFNELIDIDIPPPPDLKAEYFLYLIQDEYNKIKRNAKDVLVLGMEKEEVAFYANKNIQIAKKIAIEAHDLSKPLKPVDLDELDSSDSYILYILKLFLKRSIIDFQSLFEPYLECRLLTEEKIRTQIYKKKPIDVLLKGLIKHTVDIQQEVKSNVEDEDKAKSRFSDSSYVFSLEGDFWTIKYNGVKTNLKDLKRLRYIVHLIDNPNKEYHCHELVNLVNGENSEVSDSNMLNMIDPIEYNEDKEQTDQKIQLVDPFESDMPHAELKAIKKVADGLWGELNDPNLNKNEKTEAQNNWDTAKKYYLNELGISLISTEKKAILKINKRLKNDFEKARSNVRKNINNALKDIKKKIPALSEYLNNRIRTGIKCSYKPTPDEPFSWTINWNS